ncbi:MAG: sensor domain-containing diguanylate cyclase [Christensenellales bacterium]
MRKNVLMHTNLLVCVVIILGFVATAVISYRSNQGILRKDVENVTALTSEGIYHQIDAVFIKPVNISLTMANDSLLKQFLADEPSRLDDDAFVADMREYLDAYREKYGYDSVFLASAQSRRYYHFNGLDRVLQADDPENVWFDQFLQSQEEYALNIDNDEVQAASNEITVFINCRIRDSAGETMGVVGVGFRVSHLQELFRSYEEKFGVSVCLIDRQGTLQISTDRTGYEAADLFADCSYPELREDILANRGGSQAYWHGSAKGSGYLISAYVENLGWHLIVENDTAALDRALTRQLVGEVLIVVLIIAAVLVIITSVIRKYNRRIIELTVAHEQARRDMFQKATEQLYENIHEFDITHDRAASEATEQYLANMGADSYSRAVQQIAQRQVEAPYRQQYLDTFSRERVLSAFADGRGTLSCEFRLRAPGGGAYFWMRVTANLFHWDEDDSVRMLLYQQNIDQEKSREAYLVEQMQRDSLTGLFNKAATQEHIRSLLAQPPKGVYAFFMMDIDDFKRINDRLGHDAGDRVLSAFAQTVRSQFRPGDVVGRIGGDEFVAFLPMPDAASVLRKAQDLVRALNLRVDLPDGGCEVTSSVGVAISPQDGGDFDHLYRRADAALYRTKARGKRGYSLYSEPEN